MLALAWAWGLRGLRPAAALYARALRIGRFWGVQAGPTTTPHEFAAELARRAPVSRAAVQRVAELYAAEQYGRRPAHQGGYGKWPGGLAGAATVGHALAGPGAGSRDLLGCWEGRGGRNAGWRPGGWGDQHRFGGVGAAGACCRRDGDRLPVRRLWGRQGGEPGRCRRALRGSLRRCSGRLAGTTLAEAAWPIFARRGSPPRASRSLTGSRRVRRADHCRPDRGESDCLRPRKYPCRVC
ncbi:MAG: hypothetical protein KatS3mg059_1202 [Thermomicrobiales bacterium]|nr:MAG: hypothetical protein KatS3mg059_1202 [Thermomicrobiales bacterium]